MIHSSLLPHHVKSAVDQPNRSSHVMYHAPASNRSSVLLYRAVRKETSPMQYSNALPSDLPGCLSIFTLGRAGPGRDLTANALQPFSFIRTAAPYVPDVPMTLTPLVTLRGSGFCQQVRWPALAFCHKGQRGPRLGTELKPLTKTTACRQRLISHEVLGNGLDMNACIHGPEAAG